jgi:fructose-bisphosphate aldolase class II
MFDGSNLSLGENLETPRSCSQRFAKNDLILEIETGAVGGEEEAWSEPITPISIPPSGHSWRWRGG